MKTRTEMKSKVSRKVNPQQVVYDLKHRVVLALNKIADRDTYQVGVEELEKTAKSLNPDGIIPFLSCVLDTDSEQKSAVRKESVRMMGVLAKAHAGLVGPHLGKMVASIAKRLKDQDSAVRETCVETMGLLASKFGNHQVESDGIFVLLARPLFEALGEQNKHIQLGAAMCLARVIDNMNDPPVSILQKMLTRTMKLLKNPNFMAKPAVIELNRSLIQAGGALSHSALSTAISSIQEALNDRDWTTRKAASLALGEIGSSGGSFLAPFKVSCIQALESCRFDKVKPVRDAISQSLCCWKSIEGHNVPEPLDSMSETKDILCGDDRSDLLSAGSSMRKDIAQKECMMNIVKKRPPPSDSKGIQNISEAFNESNNDDWHIDVAVPKAQHGIPQYLYKDESDRSSVTKTLETVTADVLSMQDAEHGYESSQLADEKQDYSSASNRFSDKFIEAAPRHSHRGALINSTEGDGIIAMQGNSGVRSYKSKMEDRRSLDSTITDAEESQPVHVFCSQTQNEISLIWKQLSEIEKKQSSLMDILQGFTASTMESLSVLQLKVSSMEQVIDRIALELDHGEKHTGPASMQNVKKCQSVATSMISTTSTPRLSVEIQEGKPFSRPLKNKVVWEGKSANIKSKNNSVSLCLDSRRQPLSMMNRDAIREGNQKSIRRDPKNMGNHQSTRTDSVFIPVVHDSSRQASRVGPTDVWKCVKGFLSEGDLDSAYRETLHSGNGLLLVELINGTGPVLDSLSNSTVNSLLSTLSSCVSEHGILDLIIPWLQQVVDLSIIHGPNCILISPKVRRQIISAMQEALDLKVAYPPKRRLIAQLAMKLQHLWGKTSVNIG